MVREIEGAEDKGDEVEEWVEMRTRLTERSLKLSFYHCADWVVAQGIDDLFTLDYVLVKPMVYWRFKVGNNLIVFHYNIPIKPIKNITCIARKFECLSRSGIQPLS